MPKTFNINRALGGNPLQQAYERIARLEAEALRLREALSAETRRADTEETRRLVAEQDAETRATAHTVIFADGRLPQHYEPETAPNRARHAAQRLGVQTRVLGPDGRVVWDSLGWAATSNPPVRFP
ncbi:MAG: hypothetical protein JWR63_1068 [Conexibacter sp.]|nr:hypothetical protein [Conexibacter sp.]